MPSSIALVHSRRKHHFPLPSFVDVRLPTYHNAFIAENVQRSDCQAEYITTPIHLCRLRYFGDEDGWGFAFPIPTCLNGQGPSHKAVTD